jgi:pimeloyl-ACP methyl ester carboxylesterase
VNFIALGYPAYAYTGGRALDASLPAIVFVHGAALDHSVWQWQSRYFAHHGHCTLAVDLPGHGRSPGAARTSIEGYADWLAAFIEAAGLKQAALVGHSMGSLVALDTAMRHGARVAKLALVGASVPMGVGDAFLAAARDDAHAGLEMEGLWGHARQAVLAQSAVPGLSQVGASLRLLERARPGVQYADLQACNAYKPAPEAIAALRVPTLVLAGKRDQMTAFKAGQALAAQIPGARFAAIDAGHSMMSEAPSAVLRALRDFVG